MKYVKKDNKSCINHFETNVVFIYLFMVFINIFNLVFILSFSKFLYALY